MPRTPEQKAADEALTDAIEAVWHAYASGDQDPGVLNDYIMIGTRVGFDEDGDQCTSVGAFTRDNNVPIHVQLGLLEHRAIRLRGVVSDLEEI